MANDREITYELALELAQFSKNVELASAKVDQMNKRIEKSLVPASKSAGVMTSTIKSIAATASGAVAPIASMAGAALSLRTALAGAVSTAAIIALGQSFVRAGLEAQKLQTAFSSIQGSSKAAAEELNWLRSEADKLGLDFNSAANAYKTLAAASQGTSLAGQKTRETFLAIAKASTVMGLSADETSGALLAISQMISKGKVSAEELRGQLGERLPGAFQIAAKAMGMTTEQLDKFMSEGKLMAANFIPKFAAALSERFAGGAKAAAIGFTASSNRITNEVEKLKTSFGAAVTDNQFFIGALNILAASLNSLGTDITGNAGAWRQWSKESALAVLEFVANSSDGFNDVYKTLSNLAGLLNLSKAGAMSLGQGFQYLFEQANLLTGNTEKAAYWAKAQQDAAKLIDDAMMGAVKSFDKAEQGSDTLNTITERIKRLKAELEKIPANSLANPVGEIVTKETVTELQKIGGEWVNLQKTIEKSNQVTTSEVKVDWAKVFDSMEASGKKAASELSKALDEMAKPRTVDIKVREVVARSEGGPIPHFARGGRLPGYGGGDKVSALLEAGEFVIRKEAVAKYGQGVFAALNNLRLPIPQRYAEGGAVAMPTGAGGDVINNTINLHYQGSGSQADAKRMADVVFAEINRRWRARS